AAALANWKTVLGEQAAAAAPAPELRPVTATLASLPAGLRDYPRLPLVVIDKDAAAQSEEETRESLRRFLTAAAPLLGVDMKHLALVGVSDAPAGGGARRATYQQNPFAYPLRNGYGAVEVTFTPDLRVVGLSSTAVPHAEPLARALAAVPKTLTAEQAAAALANRPVTYTDRAGAQQTRTLAGVEAAAARQFVVFPVRRDADPASLELHVAWEVEAGSAGAPLTVYVDAATGDVLGAEQSQK
ncbi:MAG TPA: PepSY domain-containing protein, partial [Pyrinomonadaceae bacterium]